MRCPVTFALEHVTHRVLETLLQSLDYGTRGDIL